MPEKFNFDMSDVDTLTKLFRRETITSYTDYLIEENIPFCFMILDIDNFKLINDNYGHLVGDIVLRQVADSLKKLIGDAGVVGRYGGDEFIFILPNIVDYQDVWNKAFLTLKSTNDLIIPDYNEIQVTYTMGISRFPENAKTLNDLILLADKALYRGKIKGRNCFIIYLPEKHAQINLEATREKIYSPIFLHQKIFSMLTKNKDYKRSIESVIKFVGSYFLIDRLCIDTGKDVLFVYKHPLSADKPYKSYNLDLIEDCSINGIFVENTINDSKIALTKKLYKEFSDQGIYSSVLCRIQAFDKIYGYIRADIVTLDTGRIWQNEDLVTLKCTANYIALLLYSLNTEL